MWSSLLNVKMAVLGTPGGAISNGIEEVHGMLTGLLLVLNLLLTIVQQEELESVRHVVNTELHCDFFVLVDPPRPRVVLSPACLDLCHCWKDPSAA